MTSKAKETNKNCYSYLFSFSKFNLHQHCSCYLLIIIAFVLLGFTNATNEPASIKEGFIENIKHYGSYILEKLQTSDENSTTTATTTVNETANQTEIVIFNRPIHMSSIRAFFIALLRVLAQLFMIVSH